MSLVDVDLFSNDFDTMIHNTPAMIPITNIIITNSDWRCESSNLRAAYLEQSEEPSTRYKRSEKRSKRFKRSKRISMQRFSCLSESNLGGIGGNFLHTRQVVGV